MSEIFGSYTANLKLWKYHFSLWVIKLLSLWTVYITFSNILDKALDHRDTLSTLWAKTDFNFLADWVKVLPGGAVSGLMGGIVLMIFVWFIIDTIYDILIISGLKEVKIVSFGKKLYRMFLVRLAFWVPFLLLAAGSLWLAFKFWTLSWSLLPLLGGAFIGLYVLLFLIKWIDMVKIDVVLTDTEKIKAHFSTGTSHTFTDWRDTLVINLVFALISLLFVYLTIEINVYFIATGSMVLMVLWLLRQLLVLFRQITRYAITGVWLQKQ